MPEASNLQAVSSCPVQNDSTGQATVSLDGIDWLYRGQGSHYVSLHAAKTIAGDIVKSSRKRLVIRSSDGIFVKEIYYEGMRSIMKTLAGGNACKEGNINLELARRQINVPEVLGFGVVKRFGMVRRDLLLTEMVQGALSLQEFIPSMQGRTIYSVKQGFIEAFAQFIKTLHAKGVQHTDLHVGNILIREQNGARFYLLDVDRVLLKEAALSEKAATRNLALLLCTFWSLSSSLERLRFLKCYSEVEHLRSASGRVEKIKQEALRISHRAWNKKAKRSLRTNSRFIKSRYGAFSIYRVRSPEIETAVNLLLPNPDDVLHAGEVLKNGRTVKAAKVRINGRTYFLKRYNCKGNFYRVRNAFRRSRAVRTWFATWSFTVRNVPVPLALACLEERHLGLLERSYILYEFVKGERLCDIWPLLDEPKRRSLLSKAALTIGNMHLFGGFHGDLKWPNILVSEIRGRFHITLSDLDGSRIFTRLKEQKARKDMMRFLIDLRKWDNGKEVENLFGDTWCKWSGVYRRL
ncbi:MAG: lipopolysaccharide kinase InaA family protein [Desulforhabdus sp.]|nr:lipopolysaccharide kinase InaA family protein [Desulforhabdus sp.]